MNASSAAKASRLRASPLMRLGVLVLSTFVVAYLTVISASWLQEPHSPRRAAILATLWVLGIVALTLLIRGYRRISPSKSA